ncbi:MAG: HemK family protein methyltransferase [bacterium]
MTKEFEWLLKEKYNGVKSDQYLIDVARIEKGEPVDYVIGFSNFLGARIGLEYKPLIPRVETEYWVEKAIIKIKEKFGDAHIHVLDMFAGSGCVGIAVLTHIPNSRVDFADIDESMVVQIQKNLNENNIAKDRYKIFVSNIFEELDTPVKYDVILANPPYIDRARNITQDSVIAYEPHRALFAEKNGMQIIESFFNDIKSFLKSEYMVFVEHDDDQVGRIESILVSQGFENFLFQKDQYGLQRWVEIST